MSYQARYLKYKNKYIELKNQYGGDAKIGDTVFNYIGNVLGKITSESQDRNHWNLDVGGSVSKNDEGKSWHVSRGNLPTIARIDDIVVDINTNKVWGKITGKNEKVWFLDNGSTVKRENEGILWKVLNVEGVSSEEVSRRNAILNVEKPLTQYNIYSVYWIYPNDEFRPEPYSMSATFKLVVSARNDQEAFDFIQTIIGKHDTPNHDTQKFWSDKSKLVFNLVGKSNLHSVALICKDSQQDTG